MQRRVPRARRQPLRWLYGLFAASALIGCAAIWWPRNPHRELVFEAAGEAGVEAALVDAIVWKASGYDAEKQHEGAYGLMQIGIGTAMEWAAVNGIDGVMATDLLDARTNLQAGTWYLSRALARWLDRDDPVAFALADYFAGPDAVRVWAGESRGVADLLAAMRGTPAADFVESVLRRTRRAR